MDLDAALRPGIKATLEAGPRAKELTDAAAEHCELFTAAYPPGTSVTLGAMMGWARAAGVKPLSLFARLSEQNCVTLAETVSPITFSVVKHYKE